jgi:hypothetical protein
MNKYNENDVTHKSELNATMAFTQTLAGRTAADKYQIREIK